MVDFSRYLFPGAGIWWGQFAAEPTPLIHELLDQVGAIGHIKAFLGLTRDKRFLRELPKEIDVVSYGALGGLRQVSEARRLEVVPCNYSMLPRLFAERRLPSDVGLVQVAPPDADGYCSLGIGVEYVADAASHTPVLIAEINRRMPSTRGSTRIHISRFAAIVESDRPLPSAPHRAATDVEKRIAVNIAGLVCDGDTVQMGVGSLPAAVSENLLNHKDIGIHSGMISDGILALIDKGVVTGARKEVDAGLVVAGAAIGSATLYDRVPDLPVEFRPASYTHSPGVLAMFRSLVSINSAIEVDLTGQVGAEYRRGVYVGAVGGQADFSRAAAVTGARSIIAIRSTSRGESTIKTGLEYGAVTTSKADVDYVVTEHGVAELRGADLAVRARRLVAVAAPEHRDRLLREIKNRRLAS